MGLIDRIDTVARLRALSDRGWSLRANLSERYITVQRARASEDPAYVLPERGAAKLAAAANVSPAWLRFGEGAMELTAPSSPVANAGPRNSLIETLARSIADMTAAGDLDGARSSTELLSKLLNPQPAAARVLEHDEEAPEGESHQRRAFPKPTGTGG